MTERATLGPEPGKELAAEVTKDLRRRHPDAAIGQVRCVDFDRIASGVIVSCTAVIDSVSSQLTVRFRDEYGYYDLIEESPTPGRTG